MDKSKESKKGFWSTLFAPKPKTSCCCGSKNEEVAEEYSDTSKSVKPEKTDKVKPCCNGGKL